VRRCFSFAFGIALLLADVGQAGADSIDALAMVRQYAAVLEVFDTRLDAAQATRLALRTIAESSAYGIDARLVVALVAVESSWNPAAVSSAGAHGLGQLMPGTAAGLGVNPDDPDANLDGTIRHLRWLLSRYERFPPQSRFERSIAAYNAGAGAVDRYGGVPPYAETQAYVRRVVGLWRRLAGM
jgi:soluble lytic murein transglycosylase-like protein